MSPEPSGSRLNTWKEIAAYLGKGVRTVERWEVNLGLPVHRVRSDRGDSVYALKGEIDAWLETVDGRATADAGDGATNGGPNGNGVTNGNAAAGADVSGDSPGDARVNALTSPRVFVAALAVVLIIAAGSWFSWLGPRLRRGPEESSPGLVSGLPASWRLVDGQVAVFDADGRRLWKTQFPFSLDPTLAAQRVGEERRIALEDIDGDGRRELLILAAENAYAAHTLICYNSDGTERFRRTPDRTVRFGDVDHTPPFSANLFWLTPEPGRRRTIWFAVNHVLGPSGVEKLDASGRLLGEYWGYGHVSLVADARVGGRRVVLVGATNNESAGSSLAVLDYDTASATAPAATDHFRCSNCPGGPPLHFFVFPQDHVSHVAGSGRTLVNLVLRDAVQDRLIVQAFGSGRIGTDTSATVWAVLYTFDQAFNLRNVEFTEDYRGAHARLRALGLLHRPLGPQDLHDASRVVRWDGTRFTPVRPKP